MLGRQIIAACFLCTVMSTSSSFAQVDSDSRPANSFRSELWRMEFRDDEKQETVSAEEDRLPDVETVDQNSPVKRQQMTVGLNSREVSSGAIPGEARLSDLEAETPIAEWKIEEGAGKETPDRVHVTSEYTLSQVAGGRSLVQEEILSEGPSALTFLVAVVAAVVMIGAIFSGRE